MRALRRWSVCQARALSRVYAVAARWLPAARRAWSWFGPRRLERLVTPIERTAKALLFDCRMCGQCVLVDTGMACPTNCGKRMRNGPCGGVRPDGGCEVDPAMRCVWLEAGEGAHRIAAGGPVPVTRLAPVDQRLQGRSSWVPLMLGEPLTTRAEAPPLPRGRDAGSFERACASGRPVVTVEVGPPDSAGPAPLIARAQLFEGLVDAINITDGAGGNCHMSSAAAAAVLVAHGMTPVCQVTCRDRNRIAIQGDLLGAAALGVRNLLCLTGDDVSRGDHPQARAVFDLDAVSLLDVARGMRDGGVFASGRRLEVPPDLFLGATANPFAPPFADRVVNLAKKVDAGAAFVQTQFCFDVGMLERFMREVRARGLHARTAILVGVGTLASPRALRWMGAHVPGVHVPESLLRRLEDAADPMAEAMRACVETIDAVMSIDGVRGVHLMGHRNEAMLTEIIAASGLRSARLVRAA